MLKTVSGRLLTAAALTILSLVVGWVVRVATDPPDSDAPYAVTGGISGRTSAFHDGMALRYNYAFGKESPFLPSNAISSNGQFLDPKSIPGAGL
jgi:hypothetical protein